MKIATNKDANAKWYATLTPSKTAFGQWKWIGRKAFLRTPAGVFELSEYSGGTHGDVAGLDGTFTATTGAQSHMVFRFNDFLTATNPTKNTNYDAARDALKGWWNRGSVDWYIGVPASMKPFHEAINEWVLMWTGAP